MAFSESQVRNADYCLSNGFHALFGVPYQQEPKLWKSS
jgi:hypothetical protein